MPSSNLAQALNHLRNLIHGVQDMSREPNIQIEIHVAKPNLTNIMNSPDNVPMQLKS